MVRRAQSLVMLLALAAGCVQHEVQTAQPVEPAPFQQFISDKFDWSSVRRVALMPLANQTEFEHVSAELQSNLAAELERTGRFDVVIVPLEDATVRSRDIFQSGSFDELEMLRVARQHDAQAIVFGNVTHYHPYAPPRVGLSLVMISPAEGVAIASSQGLWDAREMSTARQAKAYVAQTQSWRQGLLGLDRALESPDVYQRFVCQQIASSLNPPDMGAGAGPTLMPDVIPVQYQTADPYSRANPQYP